MTPLFGPRVEGPDGIQGWLINHVEHIEETVINRAAELLKSTFQPLRLRDMFPATPDTDLGPSAAEVAAMVETLPPAATTKVTR